MTRRIRVRPTLRQNGLMMFPVRLEFTISRDHFIEIGTMKAINHEKLAETRIEWLEILVRQLREWGEMVVPDYLTDQCFSTEEITEARNLATGRINKLFPELIAKPAERRTEMNKTTIPIKYNLRSIRIALGKANGSNGAFSLFALGGSTGYESWRKIQDVRSDVINRGANNGKRQVWVQERGGLGAWFIPHENKVILTNDPK